MSELLNHEEAHSPKGKGKDWKPHQDSEVTQGSEGVDRIYDQTISSSLWRPKSKLHHSGLPQFPSGGVTSARPLTCKFYNLTADKWSYRQDD